LQHNQHELLFLKLSALTDRVSLALNDADPDTLTSLAEDHQNLMKELQNAGTCMDMRLLEQVQALSRQVSEVIPEIRRRQLDVSARIRQLADGKKMIHAYGS
jgi:hypothetical protein